MFASTEFNVVFTSDAVTCVIAISLKAINTSFLRTIVVYFVKEERVCGKWMLRYSRVTR